MSSKNAFSVSIATPAAAAGAAYAQLIPPSSAVTPRVMAVSDIAIVLNAATASSIGLIVGATKGTSSTSTTGINEGSIESAGSSGCQSAIASAWSVAPTLAGSPVYLRRVVMPAVAGASVCWSWSERNPLILPNNGTGLLLWNFGAGAGSILSIYVRWWETIRRCGAIVEVANLATSNA